MLVERTARAEGSLFLSPTGVSSWYSGSDSSLAFFSCFSFFSFDLEDVGAGPSTFFIFLSANFLAFSCFFRSFSSSFSDLTFLSPSFVPPSCPAWVLPRGSALAAPSTASLTSCEAGGGFPETDPVGTPTRDRQSVLQEHRDILGLDEPELVAMALLWALRIARLVVLLHGHPPVRRSRGSRRGSILSWRPLRMTEAPRVGCGEGQRWRCLARVSTLANLRVLEAFGRRGNEATRMSHKTATRSLDDHLR